MHSGGGFTRLAVKVRAISATSQTERVQVNTAICLFILGFFCSVLQVPLALHAAGFGPSFETSAVARSLATLGEFRDPFGVPTGPTAHVAPVYPLILAAAMRFLKQPELVVWSIILLNAALMGLTTALLPALSQQVLGRRAPGVAGGILLALSSRLTPQWEATLAGFLLLAATLAILDRGPIAGGLWSGACILTSPLSLPALAFLLISRGRRFLAVSSVLALCACAPWILRNWVVLGTPYFIRDNLGLELYVSNNTKAAPELVLNESLETMHPSKNAAEAALVARLGEGPYNRMRLGDAFGWMRSHPRQLLKLTAVRAFYYWLPSPSEGWSAYGYWLATGLGIAGAWLARRSRLAMLLAATAVIWSLPFLLIQTAVRYRAPSFWISALLSGIAIEAAAVRIRVRVAQPRVRPSHAAAASMPRWD